MMGARHMLGTGDLCAAGSSRLCRSARIRTHAIAVPLGPFPARHSRCSEVLASGGQRSPGRKATPLPLHEKCLSTLFVKRCP